MNPTQSIKSTEPNNKLWLTVIYILGVVIPVVVAFLLLKPKSLNFGNLDVSALPHFNAILNSLTAFFLVIGYSFIKRGNKIMHRRMMLSAFILSSVFLVSYVVYHFQAPSTKFGDANGDAILSVQELAAVGYLRMVYLILLLAHIVLAAVIVPFVLLSIYFGITNQFERHKKVSQYTFPMWLFVAVSGVVVYLMISPYYNH